MSLKFSGMIFKALETSAASLISAASTTSLALPAYKALFPQINSWSWWLDHTWHQKDQYGSFCVEWIIKNPIEASQCYFSENFLMKLKCSKIRMSFKQNITCIFLSVRHKLLLPVHRETPCSWQSHFLVKTYISNWLCSLEIHNSAGILSWVHTPIYSKKCTR